MSRGGFSIFSLMLKRYSIINIIYSGTKHDSFQEVSMSTAYEFIKANQVFHIATVDGAKARVRPFGFIMKRNDRLYFCTNKTKDVYKQMVKNPDVEISCMGTGGQWLRLQGKVVFDENREAKAQAFKESARLLQLYPKGADDEIFITFYLKDAQAILYSFTDAPKNIPLF
jgi:uncharacterized pyridoxamine 5'-phosphate oxidase family protein